jgi:hypothetical protein
MAVQESYGSQLRTHTQHRADEQTSAECTLRTQGVAVTSLTRRSAGELRVRVVLVPTYGAVVAPKEQRCERKHAGREGVRDWALACSDDRPSRYLIIRGAIMSSVCVLMRQMQVEMCDVNGCCQQWAQERNTAPAFGPVDHCPLCLRVEDLELGFVPR